MTTLTTLSNLNDAYLLRSMLEAGEIPAFIPDEYTCQIDWGYINAIGGVRVQIPEEFAEEAVSVLKEFKDGSAKEIAETAESNPEFSDATTKDVVPGWSNALDHLPQKYAGWGPLLLVFLCISSIGVVAIAVFEHRATESSAALSEGNAAYNEGDYSLAVAAYSRALESDPNNERIYACQGLAYDSMREYDRAIADYTHAIMLDSSDEHARVNRGKAYADEGNLKQAMEDSTQALLLDPKDTQACFNRGDFYLTLGQYDKAIADFSEAIRIDSRDGAAYFNRGWAYDAKGDFAKAIADYTAAMQIDPKNASAYHSLAWDFATSPQTDIRNGKLAIEYANRACELSGWNDDSTLDTLAAAYAEAGDFKNAVKWESASLESPKKNPNEVAERKKRLNLYDAHQPYRAAWARAQDP